MVHGQLRKAVLVFEDREQVRFPANISKEGQNELRRSVTSIDEVKLLSDAIEASGLLVETISIDDALARMRKARSTNAGSESGEIYWNITDGDHLFKGANIPALAFLTGKPFFGSSTYVRGLATRKHHWKALAKEGNLPVPEQLVIRQLSDLASVRDIAKLVPAFVKPAQYGNSAGIDLIDPIAKDPDSVIRAAEILIKKGLGPVIIEPFLAGEEIAVSAVQLEDWKHGVFSKSYPGDYLSPAVKDGDHIDQFGATSIDCTEAIEIARRLTRILGLKDIFRLDLRRNQDGELMLIDVNAGCYLMGSVIRDFIAEQRVDFPSGLRACLDSSFSRQTQ